MEKRGSWTSLSVEKAYESPWITVNHHEVLNPNGNPGIYGVVHFKNTAIGILPLDEEGNTWIVGQHRFPLDQYSWEIPEGGGQIGVPPIDSAQRELLEETGIVARDWTPIQEIHLSNSVSDEYGIIYLAQGLEFKEAEPEDTEDLQVRKLPFEELYQMVQSGEVTDSLTIAAVLKVKIMMLEGQLKKK